MRISDWSSDVCSSDLRTFVHRPISRNPAAQSLVGAHRRGAGRWAKLLPCRAIRSGLLHPPPSPSPRNRLARRQDWPDRCRAIALPRPSLAEARRRDDDRHHAARSEEHTSELQSLMRTSYAVFCLKKKKKITTNDITQQ